ncbi:hypothetical protein [Neobacillus drentensis]
MFLNIIASDIQRKNISLTERFHIKYTKRLCNNTIQLTGAIVEEEIEN